MPQSFEVKRSRVNERKSSLEQAAIQHGSKIESILSRAEKNRQMVNSIRMMKVQEHLNKVDEVRKQKSIKEQSTIESMQDDIKMKHEAAEMRRQTKLNQVIDIAQKSAEKRKPSVEQKMWVEAFNSPWWTARVYKHGLMYINPLPLHPSVFSIYK